MADESSDPEPTNFAEAPEVNSGSASVAAFRPQGTASTTGPNNAQHYSNVPKKRTKPCIGGCLQRPKFPTLGIQDIKDPNFGRMLFAEFLGTCLLVFFGIVSVVTSTGGNPSKTATYKPDKDNITVYSLVGSPDPLHISFAFGLAVATIAQAVGHVSGAHLNPAVSFGLMMAGKCSFLKALCYTLVQCLGSALGAVLLWLATHHIRNKAKDVPDDASFQQHYPIWSMGVSEPAPGVHWAIVLFVEFILTFLLVFTVCSVCDELRKDIKGSAPLAIGIAVFVCHLTGIGFTGCSVNPARSIGPALLAFRWGSLYLYLIGPMFGGLVAGIVYAVFFNQK